MKARRASLTPKERAAMIERQGGLCFIFGCTGKPVRAEHWTCVAIGNDQKPDCMLCAAHAKEKDKRDAAMIAKVKRIRKRAAGVVKKKRKIAGRGFRKDVRKTMRGEVVRR